MRKKALSWILTVALMVSMFVSVPITAQAAEVTQRYMFDAEVLPDGTIGVLFIYGGTSSSGIVSGGSLYLGVYDPDTNSWSQQPVTPGGGSAVAAKDAAMALDSSGKPHVVYVTADNNLGYTYCGDSSWTEAELIDSIAFNEVDGPLSSPDIAVDSSGYAHISYMDAKGGYTGGNDYSSYDKDDLVYAQNTSGSFIKTVRSYSHGWFYSPDGWRNLVYAPTKIALTNNQYCIGVKQYQYDKSMVTQYHTYGYDLFFESTSLNYPIRSATTNNDLGFKLFGMNSDGSTVYSLFNKSSTLYVTGGVTEIPAATKAFSATTADMTVSGSNVYYAAMNGTSLLFYQNGSFVEGLTATTQILSDHPRMATVVTGGNQYILYTGNDTDKSLFIASVPAGGGDLTEYQVPNKTPIAITGVTVDGKEYDGTPITPGGTLAVTGAELTEVENDLIYAYNGISGTVYPLSTIAPTDAGIYELIVSVSEDNETYTGTSVPISFTITKKAVTVTGTTAVNRVYSPGDVTVTLNTGDSALSGVIAADESDVTLEKSGAAGTITTDGAGNEKSVTVTGFALSGSKVVNYALNQPADVSVDIAPAGLAAPTISLLADNANGGLSATVSDDVNSLGVSSYIVEIYEGNDLKKTLTEVNKESAQNIPLETGIIEPESTYTAKAKAVADASGNYADSALGSQSLDAIAQYFPLGFTDSAAYDIPASQVDKPITGIDVSSGVTGGKAPYVYSATGLPAWLSIDANTGIITGTPTAVAAAGGIATVTVTDAQSNQQSITIAYGIVEKGDALNFGGTTPPAEKVYGDPAFDIAGLTYDDGAGTVSYSYVSGPGSLSGTTLTITGAGDIVVQATGTSANYEDKTENYTITVNPMPVTITPTGTPTKTYGEVDPELTYSSTSLVEGNPLSGDILTRAAGENTGDYAISLHAGAAAANPNYYLTLASGTYNFTITKKALTISGAVINAKSYDGTTAIELSDVTSVTLNDDIDSLALGTDFEVTAASYSDDAFAETGKTTSITVALKNTAKANNYEFTGGAETYAGATADITAAIQTITAANQTLTVTHTLDLSTIASSNADTDATLTYAINGGTSDYATLSGSVLTGTTPGTLTININSAAVNVNSAGDDEYSAAAQKQITVIVSAKINADADISFEGGSITYGQTYTPSPTTTLTGGAWNYQYAGTANDGTTYDSTAAPTKAGSYTVTATFENNTHMGAKTVILTIAAKNIFITGITATPREYDGTTDVNITGGILNGIVGDDAVTPTVPATGTISDANAGNNKTVTLGTITLTGADKDNYTLTQPVGITVNIAPKVITFTVEAVADQEYTGSQLTPEPTVKDSGATLTKETHYTLSYDTNLNAGTGVGSITVTGIGNYLGSSAEAAFDITKATYGGSPIQGTKQVISNTVAEDVTYDLSALNFPAGFSNKNFKSVTVANDSEGLLSGESLSGSILTFDVASKVAGTTGELHVVVGSTNYNDYTVVLTVTTVDKTPVTVTGVTIANKTYDATPVVPGGAPTNSDGYNGIYEYWYNGAGSTVYDSATAPTNAGDYRLTVRIPAADPTYTGEQLANFSISKAALTVKPQNMSIYIGDSLPTPTIAYEGLQGSDTGADVAQLSSGNLDMEIKASDGVSALTNSTTAGSYAIVFTGLPVFSATDNYTIVTAAGVLTITNRPSNTGGGGGGSSTPTGQQVTVSTPDGGTVVAGTLTESGDTEQINISGTQFRTLTDANQGAMISAPSATITFDFKAINTINGASSTGDVVLTIEKLDQSTLTPEQQKRIGDRPVYDFTLTKGGQQITHFNGGHAKISIPYTLADGENPHQVVIYYLTSDGTLKLVRGHYDADSKCVVFETTHFSTYAVGYNPVSFNDVAAGAWYKDAIDFIAAREITSGTSVGEFSPEATLTRGQFIVLLMNAYGISPDAVEEGTTNFVDAGNTYYTNYLLAAKSLGIVNGIGNNMFAPEQAVTRQEMFVMLYNALEVIGELPQAYGDKQLSDFGDANQVASWAQEAMSALIEGGVISGSNGMLTPTASTTRAQMAQMLYNLLSK